MMMGPRLRKLALTTHLTISLSWLGGIAAFLALAITGLVCDEPQTIRASYIAMNVIGWWVVVPLSIGSLLTGLIQSLGTPWGLFRHHWVLIKLLISILATIILLLHMQPTHRLAELAAESMLSGTDLRELRVQLIADASAALFVLLVATTLAVYKPRGLTDHGRRTLNKPRTVLQP